MSVGYHRRLARSIQVNNTRKKPPCDQEISSGEENIPAPENPSDSDALLLPETEISPKV
jgi:hypothetical protein